MGGGRRQAHQQLLESHACVHANVCRLLPCSSEAEANGILRAALFHKPAILCRRHELGEGRAPAALLGHSVGAKVALSAAAQLAEQGAPLPKQASACNAVWFSCALPCVLCVQLLLLAHSCHLVQTYQLPLPAQLLLVRPAPAGVGD